MSLRFYHRTRDGAYSSGILFEALRQAWPFLVCLAILGAAIGALHGSRDSLLVGLALVFGVWWGFRRRRV